MHTTSRNLIKIFIVVLIIIFVLAPFMSVSAQALDQQTQPIQTFELTSEILAGIAGAILSLAFSYVPGLNTKFAALPEESKQAIMAGMLLLTAGLIFGLSCASILAIGIACTQGGIYQVVWLWIMAITANQSVHRITPKTNSVKLASE